MPVLHVGDEIHERLRIVLVTRVGSDLNDAVALRVPGSAPAAEGITVARFDRDVAAALRAPETEPGHQMPKPSTPSMTAS